MKKWTFTLFLASAFGMSFAQQTTLRHFDPSVTAPVVESYANNKGFLTGHNDYGDEEFGEKYEIQGVAKLLGVSAIHLGTDGTAGSVMASYRSYSVGDTGLPATLLSTKEVSYNMVPVNGQLNTVFFDAPVDVNNQFFVSFRLGDYSHGGLGTKRIAVSHSPDGSRTSDLDVYGKNVIRWHSHGAAIWKDYRTENFNDYSPAIYFSLFPVVELSDMAVVDLNKKGSIGAVYPNPSQGFFKVPINSSAGGKVSLKLFDMAGKQVMERQQNVTLGKTEVVFSGENLEKGIYILSITTPDGAISQKVSIK